MKPIIEAENVSKLYQIGSDQGSCNSLRDELSQIFTFRRPKTKEFWALRDINFKIMPGEAIGIVGRNGAGKSTLLKILSQITAPTKGKITMRGRVASLLEVGTGFNPELSGRENIYLNGAILGMSRKEINQKFDEIVAFSEIEKFLDTPVKRYSSGMYVRLAFAVAAHLEPEILIIDEVLAVGDAQFQRKCLGKMEDVTKKDGRTILFVSHSMNAISLFCTKSLLLEKGKAIEFGSTESVVKRYLSNVSEKKFIENSKTPCGENEVRVTGFYMRDLQTKRRDAIKTNEPFEIVIDLSCGKSALNKNAVFNFCITDSQDNRVIPMQSEISGFHLTATKPKQTFVCRLENGLPLTPGNYSIAYSVQVKGIGTVDKMVNATSFSVIPIDFYGTGMLPEEAFGPILQKSQWYREDLSRGKQAKGK